MLAAAAVRASSGSIGTNTTTLYIPDGPGVAGCFRIPILLSSGTRLIAFGFHRWDSESPCGDAGLKAIVTRTSDDGGRSWGPARVIYNDTMPSAFPADDGISAGAAVHDTASVK